MKFSRDDFSRIQWSLLFAIAMVAGGVSLVLLTQEQTRQASSELSAATMRRAEFDNKLKQVRNEEAEIRSKSALFSNLSARGVIGEEQRLDWVEEIRAVREQRKLLDVQYEFMPQQALDKAPIGSYNFYSSTMRVRLKLLHEGDLLNFLADLRVRAKAFIRVRSCNITRLDRNATATDPALLSAECQIDWVTISPGKGKP